MGTKNFADILGIGTVEFILALIIIVVLFSGKKLPKFVKNLWTSLALRFKNAPKTVNNDNKNTPKTKND